MITDSSDLSLEEVQQELKSLTSIEEPVNLKKTRVVDDKIFNDFKDKNLDNFMSGLGSQNSRDLADTIVYCVVSYRLADSVACQVFFNDNTACTVILDNYLEQCIHQAFYDMYNINVYSNTKEYT